MALQLRYPGEADFSSRAALNDLPPSPTSANGLTKRPVTAVFRVGTSLSSLDPSAVCSIVSLSSDKVVVVAPLDVADEYVWIWIESLFDHIAPRNVISMSTLMSLTYDSELHEACVLRMLRTTSSVEAPVHDVPILASPRFVTGIPAALLTYCELHQQDCSVFVTLHHSSSTVSQIAAAFHGITPLVQVESTKQGGRHVSGAPSSANSFEALKRKFEFRTPQKQASPFVFTKKNRPDDEMTPVAKPKGKATAKSPSLPAKQHADNTVDLCTPLRPTTVHANSSSKPSTTPRVHRISEVESNVRNQLKSANDRQKLEIFDALCGVLQKKIQHHIAALHHGKDSTQLVHVCTTSKSASTALT
ncbi:hypothetical protein DYB36_003109 [Aphanomyces astaci]|uniref:Proteasome assembly chaperone 1 n=1 Tax=Aphanomyces astaci TaxID=112090 RepID=A0A396ZXT0_APHAT|nr:hypothetical protein DYB36_003109 [Aphanomyces astaci]